MFTILIVCGRCSLANLMGLDWFYIRVLLGSSGLYSQSHSGPAGYLGRSASRVDIWFLTPKLNYPGQFLLLQMTHFIAQKTSEHLCEIFFFNQNSVKQLSFCEILFYFFNLKITHKETKNQMDEWTFARVHGP